MPTYIELKDSQSGEEHFAIPNLEQIVEAAYEEYSTMPRPQEDLIVEHVGEITRARLTEDYLFQQCVARALAHAWFGRQTVPTWLDIGFHRGFALHIPLSAADVVHGIEYDPERIEQASTRPELQEALSSGRLQLHLGMAQEVGNHFPPDSMHFVENTEVWGSGFQIREGSTLPDDMQAMVNGVETVLTKGGVWIYTMKNPNAARKIGSALNHGRLFTQDFFDPWEREPNGFPKLMLDPGAEISPDLLHPILEQAGFCMPIYRAHVFRQEYMQTMSAYYQHLIQHSEEESPTYTIDRSILQLRPLDNEGRYEAYTDPLYLLGITQKISD